MHLSAQHESAPRRSSLRDDVAYILPMAIFLIFTQIGGTWPRLFAPSYVIKTILTAIALIWGWR
jgi:hypothetical protein